VGSEDSPSALEDTPEHVNDGLEACDYAIFVLADTGARPSETEEEWKAAEGLYRQHKLLGITFLCERRGRGQLNGQDLELQRVHEVFGLGARDLSFQEYSRRETVAELIDKQLAYWLRRHEGAAKDTSAARQAVNLTAEGVAATAGPTFEYLVSEAEGLLEFSGEIAPTPEGALAFAERACAAADSDVKWARASYSSGSANFYLNRFPEAIRVFTAIAERLNTIQEPGAMAWRARALAARGETLDQIGRNEEAIAVYDEIRRVFASATDPDLREQVARALVAKARSFGRQNRGEEAINAYDEVLARFEASAEPRLRAHFARALVNKAVWLGRRGKVDEEVKIYDEVDRRYSGDRELPLREEVARALFYKARTLLNQNQVDDAVVIANVVVARFAAAKELTVLRHVASALSIKRDALTRLGRREEATAIGEILNSHPGAKNNAILNNKCDVGIVIALKEEFAQIFPKISARHVLQEAVSQYYYIFGRPTRNGRYRCVVTFIGGMGLPKAGIVGDRLIEAFSPRTLVNIGIAGAMDHQVLVGDVVIAEQCDDYLASSKAIPAKGGSFKFEFSGDPYKTTDAFVRHADNIQFAHMDAFARMSEECRTSRGGVIPDAKFEQLQKRKIVAPDPRILTGRVASGSTVGAADSFVRWLRLDRDRKYLALEMESAGVLTAAHSRGTQTLIIRGISDFSDERKKRLDKIGGGILRRYAMNNAIALLWQYLELELFERAH
jgi:nucleoside phosphorylase